MLILARIFPRIRATTLAAMLAGILAELLAVIQAGILAGLLAVIRAVSGQGETLSKFCRHHRKKCPPRLPHKPTLQVPGHSPP